jgi:predicted ester cyclase
MNAAVVRGKYKKSDIDKAVKDFKETVLPALAKHDGARTGMLLVNRETGDGISVAIYENEAAAKSFAPKAEGFIESFKQYLVADATTTRELYEIAASTQIESKATVEKGDKAFNAHDLEAIARDTASDAEMTASGDVKLKGPQAIKEYYGAWITAFPDAKSEIKNVFTQGKQVVVEGVFVGTHSGTLKTPMGDVPATGRKVRGDYVQIFEVDRGLFKKIRLTFDQVQLMNQLGLTPAPQGQTVKSSR